jgi:hypothetical protein
MLRVEPKQKPTFILYRTSKSHVRVKRYSTLPERRRYTTEAPDVRLHASQWTCRPPALSRCYQLYKTRQEQCMFGVERPSNNIEAMARPFNLDLVGCGGMFDTEKRREEFRLYCALSFVSMEIRLTAIVLVRHQPDASWVETEWNLESRSAHRLQLLHLTKPYRSRSNNDLSLQK